MISCNEKWKLVHPCLEVVLFNNDVLMLTQMPQLPLDDLLKSSIPCIGKVSWRQALFTRTKLKETKGKSLTISKFHKNLDNMTVSDAVLNQFVILLYNLRSNENEKD